MKAVLRNNAYNGHYRLEKGQEIEYRNGSKGRIEVNVTVKKNNPNCSTWTEFDKTILE